MEITLKELGKTINYELKRTNRRNGTFRMAIKNGKLFVYAPIECPLSIIEEGLQAKASWIWEKLESSRQKIAAVTNNDTILYRGQSYPLKIRISEKPWITMNDAIVIDTPQDHPKVITKILETWFTYQAERLVPPRVFELAKQVGAYPQKLSFRNQKTRWGSCSTLGNISLNIRLLMAPPQILDYVIIHELCHLLEPNHSPRFWQRVEENMPDYKKARAWLKTNGYLLAF